MIKLILISGLGIKDKYLSFIDIKQAESLSIEGLRNLCLMRIGHRRISIKIHISNQILSLDQQISEETINPKILMQ